MRKSLLAATVSTLVLATTAVPVYAVQGATLDQRVQRLERMMENPVLLQLSRRLGEQQRQIQELQDENDRLKRDLRQLRALMDERYKENDERLSVLEGHEPKAAIPAVTAGAMTSPSYSAAQTDASAIDNAPALELMPPASEPASVPPVSDPALVPAEQMTSKAPADEKVVIETETTQSLAIQTRPATEPEKEQYKAAFALMRSSKYKESVEQFEAFMQKHPQSDLASNSAYWAGEGYLVLGNNQAALDSFLKVLNLYPDSPKVPDATLRAGDSYDRLGQSAKAKEMYELIIQERPHSRAAENARKRLQD